MPFNAKACQLNLFKPDVRVREKVGLVIAGPQERLEDRAAGKQAADATGGSAAHLPWDCLISESRTRRNAVGRFRSVAHGAVSVRLLHSNPKRQFRGVAA